MSVYPPPSSIVPIFNPNNFNETTITVIGVPIPSASQNPPTYYPPLIKSTVFNPSYFG